MPKNPQIKLAGIGIAEKGYADYKITVRSKGGHSSQPGASGIGEIAKVIRDLEGHQFKAKMPHLWSALQVKIGKRISGPVRIVTCNLWLLKPIVTLVMKKFPACGFAYKNHNGCFNGRGQPCRQQRSSAEEQHNGKLPYDAGNHFADVKEHIKNVVKKKGYRNRIAQGQRGVKGFSYGQPLLQNP